MFRLNATLVATTRTRPWRTGWSVDRGVQVSLTTMTTVLTRPCAVHGDRVAAEPACFIDEDQAAPPATATERRFSDRAGADAGSDTAGLRAWWSLSGKALRT
jgi:hypothetical protein